MSTPWQDLLARAERERDLAAAGRWDELVAAGAERAAAAAALPPAPASARPVLERLAVVQAELTATIVAARSATLRELAGVRRGQGALRAYAPGLDPRPPRGGWVDESR